MLCRQLVWSLLLTCVMRAAVGAEESVVVDKSRPARIVVSDRARKLHDRAILVDGHNDLPWNIRVQASSTFEKMDISQSTAETMHTDIPRLRAGGVKAQFWSVYVPANTRHDGKALQTTLEQIELVQAMVQRYPETFAFVTTVAEIEAAVADGKIASLIGVEGGHSIENSLAVLRELYDRGARYMTLAHSDTLEWCDSATDEQRHGGLTEFGEEVVREMNRLGMLVDISHVSDAAMKDALRVTKAPVIFSHSSARAIADHPRNVPDDVLKLTADNGGVVMVNFFSGYIVPQAAEVSKQRSALRQKLTAEHPDDDEHVRALMRKWDLAHPLDKGTVHNLLDHIEHIVRVAGIDHVGFGSDYDGIPLLPDQMEDVSTYPNLTQGLLDRGFSDEDVLKVLGGNLLRVLREAETVANKS